MISAQIAVKAKDGYAVLAGAAGTEKWTALWRMAGREDLANDPQYLGGQDKSAEFTTTRWSRPSKHGPSIFPSGKLPRN